jgi:predicted O-methyltransferase YrrM
MSYLHKHYRRSIKWLVRRSFPLLQRLGIHITLNHFYYPIPNTSALSDEIWNRKSELPGINMAEPAQLELLRQLASEFRSEYDALPMDSAGEENQFHVRNRSFGRIDAEVLYGMIRHFKPARMIEIGSGHSTLLAAQAFRKNAGEGRAGELIACEPYPKEFLRRGFPGLSRLIEKKVQEVPLAEFEALGRNDILFIDSSHVLKIGSDVQFEFLEILPRLKPGVLVHFHDIFLPEEYPRQWILEKHKFWTEQYLLQAFLACNQSFEVLWASNFMRLAHPGALREAFARYDPAKVRPGSFWIRRIQ